MAQLPVPYQPNPFQMVGKPYFQVPATIPNPASALGGVPEAVAAGEPAQLAALRMAPFLGTLGLLAGGAAYADPGGGEDYTQGQMQRAGDKNSLISALAGLYLSDKPEDLGITSIGKQMGRGALRVSQGIGDTLAEPINYLTSTNAERQAKQPKPPTPIQEPAAAQEVANPAEALGQYVIPGAGAPGTDSALDDLMKVIAAEKPRKGEISSDLRNSLLISGALDAGAKSAKGNYSKWAPILEGLAGGYRQQGVDIPLQNMALDAQNTKATQDWLKEYAKTGVDVAKEKRESKKDDFKIHASKNGFLVEMNDKNGNKVLQPISPFPNSGKIEIGGRKFTGDNPLSEELGILQNLGNVGILNDVLVEHSKDLMKATKGIVDPKQAEDAKLLTLARAMHNSPQFKASMLEKYQAAMGSKPRAATVSQPVNIGDNSDWLSALEGAQ